MKRIASTGLTSSAAMLFVLVGLEAIQQVPSGVRHRFGRLEALTSLLHRRGLSTEAGEAHTAGYYEGLLSESRRVSMASGLISGSRGDGDQPPTPFRAVRRRQRLADRYDHRRTFLYYEARPHLSVPDYSDDRLRLVTNSHGLADREYALQKPQGTWRIAVFGDSVIRGMGAPFGAGFDTLLENRLNERHLEKDVKQIEVLNFAVSGYRLTQVMEVALTKAPKFEPDVYIVALTENSGTRKWAEHLIQLVYDGIDLKYDFLKQVVRDAGVAKTDPPATAEAKLARFRVPMIRWILDQIERQPPEMVVLLVPTVREQDSWDAQFKDFRDVLAGTGVPVVDLLDTFSGVGDLGEYRVSPDNYHPNERGHRLLFEALYSRMLQDPTVRSVVTGRVVKSETATPNR